jgi:hypothetical protein
MATRIESGQMQVRSVGNAPIVQVQQQQIDYVGPRAEAQAAGTMAQILDRMSASAFSDAATMRKEEGLQFVASNPISQEQVELAKNGVVTGLGLGGAGTQNIFEQAVAKARSFELSGKFEMEGRNELAKLLADIDAGKASSEQVNTKIKTMTDGYSKSLSSVDAEAGIKFRATMATYGNTVLNAAYTAELKRKKAIDIAAFDANFDNDLILLEAVVSKGSWLDSNNQQRSIDDLVDIQRKNIKTQSMILGDASIQKEYSTKFELGLRNAKVNAVTKELMSDANMADPEQTLANIRAGNAGKMSPVLQSMIVNDFDSVAKVTANFMVAVNTRKSLADEKRAGLKREGEAAAVNLLEQIFPLPDGSPKRKQLISQLTALPEGSIPIGTLKDLLAPSGEGNAAVNFNLLSGIYNNTITRPDQIWGLVGKGITGKEAVAALRLLQTEDRRDSSTLDRGISQLAGIPVVPGSVVVLDPKGEEFKRRAELQQESLQIQAAAAAEGKTLTPRQILNQIEDNLLKRRNTEDAKAAQKRIDEFAKNADGTYKNGRDWITGPVTRDNLPALRQKAGNDAQKLRDIAELEKLLKRAEGR